MKKYFLTGLVILLPLAITIAVIGFIIDFITGPFFVFVSDLVKNIPIPANGFLFLNHEQTHRYLTKLIILVAIFLFTVFLGMVTRWFFFKSLLSLGDKILHRIPLINTVYKATQDIIKTLFVSGTSSFKQVVMVPFPREGIYALGFITSDSPNTCSRRVGKELVSVLIPTTPVPTSGFLLMIPKDKLVYVDVRPEEAIKYIVSCGVIAPKDSNQPSVSP